MALFGGKLYLFVNSYVQTRIVNRMYLKKDDDTTVSKSI
jgi:hypothetical protein